MWYECEVRAGAGGTGSVKGSRKTEISYVGIAGAKAVSSLEIGMDTRNSFASFGLSWGSVHVDVGDDVKEGVLTEDGSMAENGRTGTNLIKGWVHKGQTNMRQDKPGRERFDSFWGCLLKPLPEYVGSDPSEACTILPNGIFSKRKECEK